MDYHSAWVSASLDRVLVIFFVARNSQKGRRNWYQLSRAAAAPERLSGLYWCKLKSWVNRSIWGRISETKFAKVLELARRWRWARQRRCRRPSPRRR